MTEPLAGTTAGHNSKVRADTIRDIVRVRRQLAAEMDEIRARNKKNNARVKDLGLKQIDFNALYRVAELEDDDRDQFLDTLREGFAALGIGDQHNFLDALGDVPAAPAKMTVEDAEERGYRAHMAGVLENDIPPTMRTKKLKEAWLKGWARWGAEQNQAAERDFDERGSHDGPAAEEAGDPNGDPTEEVAAE